MKKYLTSALFFGAIFSASASTIYYNGFTVSTNVISTNWSVASSWVGGVIPTAADDVVFDSAHAAVSTNSGYVWFAQNVAAVTVNSLTVENNFFKSSQFMRFPWDLENYVFTVTKDFTLKDNVIIGTRGYIANGTSGGVAEKYCGGTLNIGGNFVINYSNKNATIGGAYSKAAVVTAKAGEFTGPLTNLFVGGNLTLSSLAGLALNVGINSYGDSVNINNPDINIKGQILSGETSNGRSFLYIGAPKSGNTSQVIACGGLSGYIGIRNNMNNLNALTTLVLNVASGESYKMSYALSDDINWNFNAKSKIAVVMNGAGTQYLGYDNSQIRFSGGVTVNSGNLFVNGKATGSDDTTYTHGDLEMNGGTFGIYNNASGAGTFTFTNCYWKNGTFSIGTYEDAVDVISFSGSFSAGDGAISNINFEFDGDCTAFLNQLKVIDCSDFSTFTKDNFKADNKFILGSEYKALFEIKSDGLYIQYVAVPEPATFAAIFGAIALALAVRRRK